MSRTPFWGTTTKSRKKDHRRKMFRIVLRNKSECFTVGVGWAGLELFVGLGFSNQYMIDRVGELGHRVRVIGGFRPV